MNAAITPEIAPGVEMISVTTDAVGGPGLATAAQPYAVIKATSVMIGVEA